MSNDTCVVSVVHELAFDTFEPGPPDLDHEVVPYLFLALALPLCFCGMRALHVVVATAAFATGVVGTSVLLHTADMPCDTRTLAVCIVSAVFSLIAVFLLKFVSTLLGAAAACTLVAFVLLTCDGSCRGDPTGAGPFLGFPLVPFWASMAAAAGVGAFVARRRYREMLTTISAVLGGFALGLSARGIAAGRGVALPEWAFLGVAASGAFGGIGVQVWWDRRKRKHLPRGLPNDGP